MRDAIAAEGCGLATAVVITSPLAGIAAETAIAHGMPDLPIHAVQLQSWGGSRESIAASTRGQLSSLNRSLGVVDQGR